MAQHPNQSNRRRLARYRKAVDHINELEPGLVDKTDDELRTCSNELRERAQNGESLDALLPETFALVREASKRTLGLRHYDVQLMGAMALHEGCIAEMKTGEGKTLVATAAAFLNALSGHTVHVVTVNDYLAKRDSEEMGQVYRFLGMDVGLLQNGMKPADRRPEYRCGIIYGTNSEFGFDYLRDNMVTSAENRVQTGFAYAIVDEVDSILIDEARTPLIISGLGNTPTSTYQQFAAMATQLDKDKDVEIDEAKQTVATTEEGLDKVERILGMKIYSDLTGMLANHLRQALRAQFLFHKDDQYVVVNGEVKIVDEFTGRILEGRRYSDGLHQAIEAKEHVEIKNESNTLATVTLQNYFRLYEKLSGMTGTAMTDDQEFRETYHLPVVEVPTNKPVIRKDQDDYIFRTMDGKWQAIVKEIKERHAKWQPILVGTSSVEASEHLSTLLDAEGIPHETLNAKNPEREARIVAEAGRRGAVTISTNMAGRGTDIKLGGTSKPLYDEFINGLLVDRENPPEWAKDQARKHAQNVMRSERHDVVYAGGLYVIGTERAESRRVDNQLRGRSGRQGDPGETRFFLSLDDRLMRLFGSKGLDKVKQMMIDRGIPEDQPIESHTVTKLIDKAQMKVEQVRFAARKQVLDYDDVLNVQRKAIYAERNKVLDGQDVESILPDEIESLTKHVFDEASPVGRDTNDWDLDKLNEWATRLTGKKLTDEAPKHKKDVKKLQEEFDERIRQRLDIMQDVMGRERFAELCRGSLLRMIDVHWIDYLVDINNLKNGIGLRGYAQRDPLVEYKNEAYRAFEGLVSSIYADCLVTLLRAPLEALKQGEDGLGEESNPFNPDKMVLSGSGEEQLTQDFDLEPQDNGSH